MELTRAAPLYAVVEGNKKCKSKRVGVGEWEKKIRGERGGEDGGCEPEKERERETKRKRRMRAVTLSAKGRGGHERRRVTERERKRLEISRIFVYIRDYARLILRAMRRGRSSRSRNARDTTAEPPTHGQ